MMMSLLLAVATAVFALTLHVSLLLRVSRWIYQRRTHPILHLNAAFMVLCAAHIVEIMVFAGVTAFACKVLGLGHLEGVAPEPEAFHHYVYFAFETYSTVGYGNVTLAGDAQPLAAMAALVGIVLTASSASLTFLAISQFAKTAKSTAAA